MKTVSNIFNTLVKESFLVNFFIMTKILQIFERCRTIKNESNLVGKKIKKTSKYIVTINNPISWKLTFLFRYTISEFKSLSIMVNIKTL